MPLISAFLFCVFTVNAKAQTEGTGESRQIHVVVTGESDAVLEVCSCPSSPRGGVARRAAVIDRYRQAAAPFLAVETGTFFPGVDFLDRERSRTYLQCLAEMDYGPVLLARTEFQYGRDELERLIAGIPLSFVAANVTYTEDEEPPWKPYWMGSRNGVQVGVIGLSAGPSPLEAEKEGWRILNATESLKQQVEYLRPKVDFLIVVTDLGPEKWEEVGRPASGIDLVANSGDTGIYEDLPEGGIQAFAAPEGTALRVVRLTRRSPDARPELAVQELVLEPSRPEDPRIRARIQAFYELIASKPEYAWGDFPNPYDPSDFVGLRYVGSESCRECHAGIYRHWQTTRHAHAYVTLQAEHRAYVPRCIGCHVVGYGERSGFEAIDPFSPLANVGCEACHGPGSAHTQEGKTEAPINSPGRPTCIRCHDQENSPQFREDEEKYFSLVAHPD